MNYKLLKEDPKAFHVQHPDGSIFQVAKSSIGADTAKKIQAFAKGGEVDENDAAEDSASPISDVLNPTPPTPQMPNIQQATTVDPFAQIKMPEPVPLVSGADAPFAASPEEAGHQTFAQYEQAHPGAGPSASEQKARGFLFKDGQMPNAGTSQAPVGDSALADQQSAMDAVKAAQGNAPQPGALAQDPMMQKQMAMFDDMDKAQQKAFAAQNATNRQVSDVIKNAQSEIAKQDNIYNASISRYQAEDERLYQQLQNKEIDPNHFYSTRSSGQKLAIGLGMALAAAGGTGSDVSNMLNRAIDRDIDAQKANMGKVESQLTINMRREGNMTSAMQVTKSQILTGMELQAKAITSAAGSPQAALQYQQARMQIQMMKMQLQQGAAMAQVHATSTRQGLPTSQEPAMLLNDPKYTKRRVLVGDQAYQTAGEDGEHMRTFENKTAEVHELLHRIDALGPDALRWKSEANLKARSLLPQLANAMAGMQSLSVNSSRISDSEIHSAEAASSDPTAFGQMFGRGAMNAEIVKSLEHSRETTRSQNLLGYRAVKSPEAYGGKGRGK